MVPLILFSVLPFLLSFWDSDDGILDHILEPYMSLRLQEFFFFPLIYLFLLFRLDHFHFILKFLDFLLCRLHGAPSPPVGFLHFILGYYISHSENFHLAFLYISCFLAERSYFFLCFKLLTAH